MSHLDYMPTSRGDVYKIVGESLEGFAIIINNNFTRIERDITKLKDDVAELKSDMVIVKTDIAKILALLST